MFLLGNLSFNCIVSDNGGSACLTVWFLDLVRIGYY